MKELKNSMNKQLASLAEWLSVHLRTKWLWVRIPLQSLKLVIYLYADIADYKSPTTATGPSQRTNIVVAGVNKLYTIELTVGFETRITINAERKKRNYEQIYRQSRNNYDEVNYFIISMGALGLLGKDSQ